MTVNSRLPGFYKLSPEQRFDKIVEASDTSAEDARGLCAPTTRRSCSSPTAWSRTSSA